MHVRSNIRRRKVGDYMARLKRRRKKKISPVTMLGIATLCGVLCFTMAYQSNSLKAQSKEYSQQISELKEEQKQLQEKKEEMKEYKSYVKTDEYIEEAAREKLGLVYPDEIIFEPEE